MVSVRAGQDLFSLAARLQRAGKRGATALGRLHSQRRGAAAGAPAPRPAHPRGARDEGHRALRAWSRPSCGRALAASGVDGVMLDVIGADETLARRLPSGPDRGRRGPLACGCSADHGLRIIPHIVLGLHYGRFLGEHRALEMRHRVTRSRPSSWSCSCRWPARPWRRPAAPGRRGGRLLRHGAPWPRPATTINLGCARPLGAVKRELDRGRHRPRAERHRLPG